MYKYLLASGGDINWMALFALVTFVIIFLLGTFLAFKQGRSHFQHMASLPLDDESKNA